MVFILNSAQTRGCIMFVNTHAAIIKFQQLSGYYQNKLKLFGFFLLSEQPK